MNDFFVGNTHATGSHKSRNSGIRSGPIRIISEEMASGSVYFRIAHYPHTIRFLKDPDDSTTAVIRLSNLPALASKIFFPEGE